jgi:hypothetical protein
VLDEVEGRVGEYDVVALATVGFVDGVAEVDVRLDSVQVQVHVLDELPRRASFLPKPFRPDQLIAVAEQALARAVQAREVVALECQRADELHRGSERILSASAASGAAPKNRIDERKGAATETTGPTHCAAARKRKMIQSSCRPLPPELWAFRLKS